MKHPWVKYVKVCLNLMTALAVLLLVLFVLPRVLRFFMPFVVGWVIALIANPLVRFLDEKIRIRRKAGSAIVIVAAIALVIGAGYWVGSILVREAIGFVHELPRSHACLHRRREHHAEAVLCHPCVALYFEYSLLHILKISCWCLPRRGGRP